MANLLKFGHRKFRTIQTLNISSVMHCQFIIDEMFRVWIVRNFTQVKAKNCALWLDYFPSVCNYRWIIEIFKVWYLLILDFAMKISRLHAFKTPLLCINIQNKISFTITLIILMNLVPLDSDEPSNYVIFWDNFLPSAFFLSALVEY